VEPARRDRLIGVYAFRTEGWDRNFHENPHLTEYGSVRLEGYGAVANEVLFAVEREGGWVFPGMEGGYTLFAAAGVYEDGSPYYTTVSNMAPGEGGSEMKVTDEGTTYSLSGTVYYGPPLGAEADWASARRNAVWTGYRVYQTEDGRIYLDGSGSSFSGDGCTGFTLSDEKKTTVNGEAATEKIEVSVSVREVPRLERLSVTQFDAGSAVLRTDDLPLTGKLPAVQWAAGAAWALVEESSPDGVRRTAYSVPAAWEEPVSHQVILLDDDGLGCAAQLTME